MQDVSHVLSEFEALNPLLQKPINSTQRIKYTCFDVSLNYIVVGSTSGSLYLFTRKPCTFLQLIPLSEGIVSRVTVSPDEKTIALATTKGTVCLVALRPTAKLIAVSNEHLSEQINCLCWNNCSSEVYIGDRVGKVSVMVLSIFAVNGMFQTPACVLMDLDSSIVQLSFSSPLLLISTLTRCYICDTVREQYKQVGNKARNGEFGACFYETHREKDPLKINSKCEEKVTGRKGLFSLMSESDINETEENNSTIFCARPGSRLWEVSTNGVVMKTLQFKDALAVAPLPTYRLSNPSTMFKKNSNQTYSPQSINFSQLFVISQKYLFSYAANGLYIIDPVNTTVILWNNEFKNIAIANVIENKIYLMTCDGEFHCLMLYSVDSLILRLYNNKQYHECLQTCIMFRSKLLKSVSNKDVSELSNFEDIKALETDEITTILFPLIDLLQSNLETHPVKLDSGIVVVNPGKSNEHHEFRATTMNYSPTFTDGKLLDAEDVNCTTEDSAAMTHNDYEPIIFDEEQNRNVNNVQKTLSDLKLSTESIADTSQQPVNPEDDVTFKVQRDLEPIYLLINCISSSSNEKEMEEIIVNIVEKLDHVKSFYQGFVKLEKFMYEVIRTAELCYFNVLLENTLPDVLLKIENDYVIDQYLKAFVEINTRGCEECACGFPYPTNYLVEPKFPEIGNVLFKKLLEKYKDKCMYLCTKVPYFWREYLPICKEECAVSDIIRLCLQTRDNVVLSVLLPLLDADHWKTIVFYVKNIEEGKCLQCNKSIEWKLPQNDPLINWSGITHEINTRNGPDAGLAFLVMLEKAMPDASFDRSIFQSLVFTKILHQHGLKRAVNFGSGSSETCKYSAMCSPKVRDQLVKVLEKDTGKVIDKTKFGNGPHHWGMRYRSKSSACPCCTLPLQTPVLLGDNGIVIFHCGHAYHANCMIEKKLTTCILHPTTNT